MHQAALDLMIDFALAELASGEDDRVRALVRELANRWPEAQALSICFAITSAAATMEDTMRGTSISRAANMAYRCAALVAADVLAIEAMKPPPTLARDLLQFWRRVDPYFLKL